MVILMRVFRFEIHHANEFSNYERKVDKGFTFGKNYADAANNIASIYSIKDDDSEIISLYLYEIDSYEGRAIYDDEIIEEIEASNGAD